MSLKIHLLGQFKLGTGDLLIELPSRPAQSLLAYLVLNVGVKHRREKLAHLLWPDAAESNARAYLRQALWRIRKSFTDASLTWEDYLQINDINVAFDSQSDYWLDAEVLLDVAEGQTVEAMIETARLYRGELLPGFYDEWVVSARDRLQVAYHQRMNLLIKNLVGARHWDDVLTWAEEWIRLGYAPEPAFRGLMMAHAGLGDQNSVNVAYRRCVESLDSELDLEPSPETIGLYEGLLRGETYEIDASPLRLRDTGGQLPGFLDDDPRYHGAPLQIDQPIFVAREPELAKLDGFLDLALSSQGRVTFITGEIGSGKTALVDEFTRRAQKAHTDLIVVRGNCNAHTGTGDPYLPFREVMELLTGDVAARWAAGAIEQDHVRRLWNTLPKTVLALVEAGPDLIDTFISGAALLERAKTFGLTGTGWLNHLETLITRKMAAAGTPLMGQSDLFEQYARVLKALAHQAPLVLVIDDLQWADLGSINLLFHLGRNLAGGRILLVGAYRTEEITLGRDGGRHPLESVINEFQRQFGDLAIGLGQAHNREFVDSFLDHEPNQLDASFREMLYRQTQGHPLFTAELLQGMQERGDLIQNPDGQWEAGPSLDWETMPARVEAVIAERIGRLAQPLWEILRVASLEGQVFTAEVIAQVCSTPDREILGLLSQDLDRVHRLIHTHSIQRLGDQLISSYRFRHIIFQKYLYGSLDEVEQVHLHQQVGTILEGLYQSQDQKVTIAPRLARHFEQARNTPKAIHYLHQAGQKAVQLSAYQEGITHLTRGLGLLMTLPASPERDRQELQLQLALGLAWVGPKAYSDEVKTAYTRARQLSQQIGDTRQLCNVLGQLSVWHFVQSELQIARELAEEALNLAEQIQDPMLETLGHWYLGFISLYNGEFTTARTHFRHVIDFYNPEIHHHSLVSLRGSDAGMSALAFDACALWCLGYPDQASEVSQDVLALARAFPHPFSLADVICYAGCWFNALRRDVQALKENSEELMHISTEKSLGGWLETGTCFYGEALALLGEGSEGIVQIRQGIRFNQELGVRCTIIGSLRALAEAQVSAGQLGESLSTLDDAIHLIEDTSEHFWETEIYRIQGDVHITLGDDDAAEYSYNRAIQVARDQKAKSWELRAAIALARLLQRQRKQDQARQLLTEIYEWFTEGFETPDLKAARTLLDELA